MKMMRDAVAKIRKKLTINPQDKKKKKGMIDDDYQVRHAYLLTEDENKHLCVAGADCD